MSQHPDRQSPMTRVVRLVAVALLVLLVASALQDRAIGSLLALMLAGGGLMGGALLWMTRHGRRTSAETDAFARDTLGTDVINASRLRVAGLGGLGLVLCAAAVALRFELTAVAMGAGLAGGGLGAAALILYRRRRGPLGTSSQGPSARVMLAAPEDDGRRDRPRRDIGDDRSSRVVVAGARP